MVRPAATDAGGGFGVTAMESNSAGVTVRIITGLITGPEELLEEAVIFVVPIPTDAASPALFMVATLVLLLVQVTVPVILAVVALA